MTLPAPEVIRSMTPMMQQYYEIKKQCADAVLFFRMGDFYEVFGDEAAEIAPKLEITLTSRERGDKNRIPFCGVPHHSASGYWHRLVRMGYRVAVADQVEDAALAKGLVKRDLVRILTPGSVDELEGLHQDRPNYVLAAYQDPKAGTWTTALADNSTGELRVGVSKDLAELATHVEVFNPKEVVTRRFCMDQVKDALSPYASQNPLLFGPLSESALRDADAQTSLVPKAVDWDEFAKAGNSQGVVAALLAHFRDLKASVGQFLTVRHLVEPDTLALHESVVRDLELFETSRRRNSDGSLFHTINRCLSPMGSRRLRREMTQPLRRADRISERHDCVASLVENQQLLGKVRDALQGFPDLERLLTRVIAGRAQPQELARVRHGLGLASRLEALLVSSAGAGAGSGGCKLGDGMARGSAALETLTSALEPEPGALGLGAGVLAKGYNAELDEYVSFLENGQSKVDAYVDRLRAETGIPTLKVKFHKTFGLIIEVTKSHLHKVGDGFIRRQTMVNCERFVTMELKDLDENLSSAKERAIAKESELYAALLLEVAEHRNSLKMLTEAVGFVDLIQSFAWLALREEYTRPEIDSRPNPEMRLEGARHPVVERAVGRDKFVSNHVFLSGDKKQILITGPNMAGKSTIMRQTAICALLCQIGSFVPAAQAVMPVFDGIYTRVGASDDLSRGLSTFMVEMTEAAFILRRATSNSLVILDEVGRGTSSEDGLAIAGAILEYVARSLGSWTLFATHYHELVGVAEALPSVDIAQTEVKEDEGRIRFTHRLRPGASGSSYGLEVAQLAGLPTEVLDQARRCVRRPSNHFPSEPDVQDPGMATKFKLPTEPQPENWALDLERTGQDENSKDRRVVTEWMSRLEGIQVHRTTPMQALNILHDLKETLDGKVQVGLFGDGQS